MSSPTTAPLATDTLEHDTHVLRRGGLAGATGSLVLLAVFVIVGVFVGADPADPEGFLTRFPEVRTAHLVENTLYLAAIALWLVHVLALHRTLRRHRPAAALVGRALAVLGLTVLAAGALPHLWQTPLADLYHAAGTTADEQATLVIVWQAARGVFEALLVTGLLLIPVGYIALGMAMRSTPAFGPVIGRLSIGLGAVGLAAASVAVVQETMAAAVAVLALIVFHLAVSWRSSRLPTGPSRSPSGDVRTRP